MIYADQQNGGDWYMADELQATGRSYDNNTIWGDRLTSVYTDISYPSGNYFVHWDPGVTKPLFADCTNTTVTVNGTLSYSYTQTKCINKDSLSPLGGGSYLYFGASWNGQEDGCAAEGEISEDLMHSPPSAVFSPSFIVAHNFNNPNWSPPDYC